MSRRSLDRKTKERFKRLTRFDDDGCKCATETDPKIPDFDDTLNPKRILHLNDISGEDSLNADDLLNKKIGELLNAAKETSKYIQNVNTHLDKQKLKVDEIKKLQKTFEKQISALGTQDEKKSDSD